MSNVVSLKSAIQDLAEEAILAEFEGGRATCIPEDDLIERVAEHATPYFSIKEVLGRMIYHKRLRRIVGRKNTYYGLPKGDPNEPYIPKWIRNPLYKD